MAAKTFFDYEAFNAHSKDLEYQGDAFVPKGETILRLTKTDDADNPQKNSVGRVVYSPKVQFWDSGKQANFQTTFKFFISDVDDTPADGIAFFIAPVDFKMGSAGGCLGIYNETNIFAVEFDIHKNHWDPNSHHVGINFKSEKSKAHMDFENLVGTEVTADVKYEARTKKVTVEATSGTQTSRLSTHFDLTSILPQTVQVGISAATGDDIAIHDLYSWSFTSTLV